MKIRVKYTAQLKKEAGISKQEIEIADKSSFQNLIAVLAQSQNEKFRDMIFDNQGAYRHSIMLVLNGSQINYNDSIILKDGDEIMLMSPIAGG